MLIEMIKTPDGFVPGDEILETTLQKFQNGGMYEVEVKEVRNPAFHRKVFAFFKFCFEHWSADKTEWKYFDERTQFNAFRKQLTILAGFFSVYYSINAKQGDKLEMRYEAKSLKYSEMDQDEFERCYNSLINAAMKHIFKGCDDQQILDRLYAFFY